MFIDYVRVGFASVNLYAITVSVKNLVLITYSRQNYHWIRGLKMLSLQGAREEG